MLSSVFVYGTLIRGQKYHHIAQMAPFKAIAARLQGFRLYHLHPEGYPALVQGDSSDHVLGELFTYDSADWPKVLPYLDELEGLEDNPPLYIRTAEQVQIEGGADHRAWIYVYAQPERLSQSGASWVKSGDWAKEYGR